MKTTDQLGFFFVATRRGEGDRLLGYVAEPPQSVRLTSEGIMLPDGEIVPGSETGLADDERLYLMSSDNPQGCGVWYQESPPRSGIFVSGRRGGQGY